MPEKRIEPEVAVLVAIDWGDQKHHWKLQVIGPGPAEAGELWHQPERIEAWAVGLRARFPQGRIAVCLEQTRGGLIYALSKYPYLVIYPVHPRTSASYREAWHPSGAKNDPLDADVLLDLLQHHRDRLQPLQFGDGRGAAHPVAGRAAAQAGSGKDTMHPTAARVFERLLPATAGLV